MGPRTFVRGLKSGVVEGDVSLLLALMVQLGGSQRALARRAHQKREALGGEIGEWRSSAECIDERERRGGAARTVPAAPADHETGPSWPSHQHACLLMRRRRRRQKTHTRPPLQPMLREVVALVAGTSAIINGLGVIGPMPRVLRERDLSL